MVFLVNYFCTAGLFVFCSLLVFCCPSWFVFKFTPTCFFTLLRVIIFYYYGSVCLCFDPPRDGITSQPSVPQGQRLSACRQAESAASFCGVVKRSWTGAASHLSPSSVSPRRSWWHKEWYGRRRRYENCRLYRKTKQAATANLCCFFLINVLFYLNGRGAFHVHLFVCLGFLWVLQASLLPQSTNMPVNQWDVQNCLIIMLWVGERPTLTLNKKI